MPSIIPGFEYDIFISYRQKDNKHDGWVTEFVNNLKGELESTFKEEISVYFDINPHDGLLETHDVDASLKEKLKCLIFIPIISRTYCDSKSFAWEHEFKAFVEQASQDQIGLKVKLPNGNVASRILPIRIHDLDTNDIQLCESVLGGVLRGVEFIYKEPGVNKPLTSEDDEKKNLNKTKYRIQINKLANAINEIVSGLKTGEVVLEKEKTVSQLAWEESKKAEKIIGQEKPTGSKKRKILTGIVSIIILTLLLAIYIYPKIFKRDTLERLRARGKISVVVMPFKNLTSDTILNTWQDWIQDNLITALSNSEELKIRQTESIKTLIKKNGIINYASLTPSLTSTISKKLEANISVLGSINKIDTTIRINAQLIDPKTEETLKSFQLEGSSRKILRIIDSLSVLIRNALVLSKMKMETPYSFDHISNTNSPEAYRYFILGNDAFSKGDMNASIKLYSQALAIDSNLYFADILIVFAYGNLGYENVARKYALSLYGKRDRMPLQYRLWTNHAYSYFFETPVEAIKYLRQLQEIDDQDPTFYFDLGNCYSELNLYDKAIPEFEKGLDLYKKWGSKPFWCGHYTQLGYAYRKTGQYDKEKKLYKRAVQDYPDSPDLYTVQAILSFTLSDTVAAKLYIDKFISLAEGSSSSEADIKTTLAYIYSEAGKLDKAETYFRQALALEPENPYRLNNLSVFLMDKARNINEGMKLADKVIKMCPDTLSFISNLMSIKGWSLYKLGRYKEALNVLQKADSLEFPYYYSQDLHLHLEIVKKTIANQK
jgi:tetratricopeptide (TPR) repeat protein